MEKRVFVAKCDDYEQAKVNAAVDRILEAFGGATAILNGGKKVLVKPNLLVPRNPEAAVTTNPAVIEAVCSAFIKAGAEVAIIDSTGGPHTKMVLRLLYGKSGMKKAAKQSGAKLSFDTKSQTINYPEGRILQKLDILSPVVEADLVITVAKAKTHGFQAMTGCVKNLFGCIPGLGKPRLHRKYPKQEDFAAMLIDICESVKPGFSLLDAVVGMEGPGPAGGDPKQLGAIVGGLSPYAIDLAQCHLMGLRIDSVCTIQDANARNLAPIDPNELTWLGDEKEGLRSSFKPATKNKNDNIPTILENCIGCGDCARICPMKCIKISERKAIIKEKECIRCYCCHEFCPVKAISLD